MTRRSKLLSSAATGIAVDNATPAQRRKQRETPVPHIIPKLVTFDEAVAYCRRSRSALYNDIRAGRLETKKFGRQTLIVRASLDQMIDSAPAFGAV